MASYPLSFGPGPSGLWRSDTGFPLASHPAPQPAAPPLRHRTRAVLFGALVVMAIASFNLFYRLDEASQPIWDENYYLTSTARYELRVASFASHPPLGLMLIAAGNHLSGANAGVDWAKIAADKKITGERMPPDFSYWGVRCSSALFGVFAAVLMFLLMAEIAGSTTAGLIAVSPFLFDTALVAQFRAAQLDSFQIFFMAVALLCLVRGDRSRTACWTLGFGVACGLATMVRANGILLLVGLLLPIIRTQGLGAHWRTRTVASARHAIAAGSGVAVAISAVFIVHLTVANQAMPASWAAARADARYVSPTYAAELQAGGPVSGVAMLQAVDGYRRFMAADLVGVGMKDSNASSPWAWPLGRKPIVYRWDSDGRTTSYVALVPNLAAWLVSLLGVIAGIVALVRNRRSSRRIPDRPLIATLLALWGAFLLFDVALAQVRVMYLYHYFVPLICGWVLAAVLIARCRPTPVTAQLTNLALVAILLNFIVLAPLALHRPLTDASCRLRTLLNGNAICDRTPSA